MLQSVYGVDVSSRSSVFEWFKRFEDGREDLQDDPRSGRPSASRNLDTVANIREMVTRGRQWALRIHQILHEDLRKKFCAKFVPHRLTDEQKHRRLTSCRDLSR
jgi:hypothetical protein